MSSTTTIEWTQHPVTLKPGATWSPVTGCTDADESCAWCYAKRLSATRLRKQDKYKGVALMGRKGPQWSGDVRLHPAAINEPLRWTERRCIFVCSMSDLFHKDVPLWFIAEVYATMVLGFVLRGHLHMVLTKRAKRAYAVLNNEAREHGGCTFFELLDEAIAGRVFELGLSAEFNRLAPHGSASWQDIDGGIRGVRLGISAGKQSDLERRWPWLRDTPAQSRFLSLEPLIGAIYLDRLQGYSCLDSVVVGGESGTRQRSRPPHPEWFRLIRSACAERGLPFFFKQWGNWVPAYGPDAERKVLFGDDSLRPEAQAVPPEWMRYASKKDAGRFFAGMEHNAMPKVCCGCYAIVNALVLAGVCEDCGGAICRRCVASGAVARTEDDDGDICHSCQKDGRILRIPRLSASESAQEPSRTPIEGKEKA